MNFINQHFVVKFANSYLLYFNNLLNCIIMQTHVSCENKQVDIF